MGTERFPASPFPETEREADSPREPDMRRAWPMSAHEEEENRERLEAAERELADVKQQLHGKNEELRSIRESRVWKLASVYWAFRRSLRRLAGGSEAALAAAAPDASRPARPAPFVPAERHDVVCFPIIDWYFRFQRPQQLMSQFAAAGHRVFYVAPRFRASGPAYEIKPIRERIFEVSLKARELNIYTHTVDEDTLARFFEGLDGLRRDWDIRAALSFVQLPFWYPVTSALRDRMAWPLVYDCMDHHAGFGTNRPEMLEQEDRLRLNADLVVTSSIALETVARQNNRNVLLVRNGCDFQHFAGTSTDRAGTPVIGYYGAIAEWFDSDLVADLAERRPDWRFVLVGSTFTADLRRLARLENVDLVGEVPYGQVPRWLSRFDVTILPFRRNALTEATNPVKAYEILAAGKPLVSVPLPEMVRLAPLIRLASNAEEFEKEISEELRSRDTGKDRERRAFAAQNTWTERFESLAPVMRRLFPKVSIAIVTYGNLEMNRRCLEAIYARTVWPNFEVIVVDNGSTDGTPEFLRSAQSAYPGLSVVLNGFNAGFASATNRALEKASGEYLVLLNNDTVVARGWLETLLRHLATNPEIGILGPVTNAIGNEARVDAGYTHLEQMPAWAQDYTRRHADEVFEIPMLAMFCVAMRREVFEKVGPLDERFGIGMFEDDDYTLRVRKAGYRVACARDSFVHHWMKAAFKKIPAKEYQALFERNRRLFEEKWGAPWVPHQAARTDPPGPLLKPPGLRPGPDLPPAESAADGGTR
jgi:GT2 family glycosyltransferase/glycosyltransferase involved in cell wall biosynthesis